MRIPLWLTLVVAGLVGAFGAYRISLFFRTAEQEKAAVERGGLYGLRRRTHLLIGVVYLLLSAGLIAGAFGWSPLAGLWGPSTEKPSAQQAPTSGGIPNDDPVAK